MGKREGGGMIEHSHLKVIELLIRFLINLFFFQLGSGKPIFAERGF